MMIRTTLRISLVLIVVVLLIPPTHSQSDDKNDKKAAPNPYVQVGNVTAKVVGVDSNNSIRLQIVSRQIDPNQVQALQKAQFDLARARNPQDAFNIQKRIVDIQRRLYKEVKQDVSLSTTDDVKIRVSKPPATFDEKGNLVPPSKEVLKELKGDDPRVPGYKAEFSDLRAEQIVQVSLVRTRESLRARPVAKGKDVDLELLAKDQQPLVSMIVVIGEPPPQ
jgi:hypothetical protein